MGVNIVKMGISWRGSFARAAVHVSLASLAYGRARKHDHPARCFAAWQPREIFRVIGLQSPIALKKYRIYRSMGRRAVGFGIAAPVQILI